MKILHLEASAGWGGQEIRILREAEGMRLKGHQIVLAVQTGGKLMNAACKAGFTCYSISFRRRSWISSLYTLLLLIRREQVELINTHSSLDAWLGGIVGKFLGVPVVRTRHLSTPIKKGWNSKLLYGVLADVVVTTSQCMVPVICQQSGKRETHCRSIPTGVNPASIHLDTIHAQAVRARFGIAPTDFLVGTACFMRSWKGISDFLQAAHLLRKYSDIHWLIIGGGHEAQYREEASRLQLDGIVHFTGHLANPLPALVALDLFALLSTAHEGVSQAILQAAYLQKPLIATPIGGLPEVCLDGRTGIIVPPCSPDQVVQSVLTLKNDLIRRQELGRAAKQLVLEKFLFSQMIDQMEEMYRLARR